MKWMSLLLACVMCVPLSGQTYVGVDAWLEAEQYEESLFVSITALEASAVPAAGTDVCDEYRKKVDQYDSLLAATFMTLLQLDGQVSDALEAYNNAVELARLQATLVQRMEERPNEYTPQQRSSAMAELLRLEHLAGLAKEQMDALDAKRAATEAYLIRLAALRKAAIDYLNQHCGGVTPPSPGPPAPTPDLEF